MSHTRDLYDSLTSNVSEVKIVLKMSRLNDSCVGLTYRLYPQFCVYCFEGNFLSDLNKFHEMNEIYSLPLNIVN